MLFVLLACIPVLTSPHADDTGPAELACGETLPENTWPAETPPASVVGEGFDPGETIPDACLVDQFDAPVDVWQFYGRLWILDVSTGWCAPCRQLAEEAPAVTADYADEGFSYVTVMPQDVQGNPPDAADVFDWADYFGITDPVLADKDGYAYGVTENSFPTLLLINRDLTVETVISPANDATIRAAIDAAL